MDLGFTITSISTGLIFHVLLCVALPLRVDKFQLVFVATYCPSQSWLCRERVCPETVDAPSIPLGLADYPSWPLHRARLWAFQGDHYGHTASPLPAQVINHPHLGSPELP